MKRYFVQTGITNEKAATDIMAAHGDILTRAGGFPLSPVALTWLGTDEGIAKLRELDVRIEELPDLENREEKVTSLKGKLFYEEDGDRWKLVSEDRTRKVNSLVYGLADVGIDFDGEGEEVELSFKVTKS